jgi:ABC-type sugar transport system permease subunit
MQMFDIPFLITNGYGSPDNAITTSMIYIYNQAFTGSRNFFMSATASVVILIVIMIVSGVIYKLMNRTEKKVGR